MVNDVISTPVVVAAGSSVSLTKGAIYTCTEKSGNGGAVENNGGTVTGTKVGFAGNAASDKGGAIFNSGSITLNNTTFTANRTTGLKGQGGAIYNSGAATLTNMIFSGSTATMGGAAFNNGGVLTITGSTVSNSKAKYGGAIQNFGGGTVNVTNTVFSGNRASDDGGAIAHNSGTAAISDATFSGNTAGKTGGAIWNKATITFSGDVEFSQNVSNSTGGAIDNEGGTINFSGTIDLQTASDTWVNVGADWGSPEYAVVNWDLTGGKGKYGTVRNFQYYSNDATNTGTEEAPVMEYLVSQTITVTADQASGKYVIATGDMTGWDTDATGKYRFTLTGINGAADVDVAVGDTGIGYGNSTYSLASVNNEKLVLTVETPHSTHCISDYNGSGKSDMVQFVNGLVYVTHDTDSGYVQTPAINDVTGWNVTEIRRDLTGDGYADVQITSDDGAGSTWVATLRNDYLSTGCITLNYQFIGAYDNQLWSYLGSADFNGDGKSEILMVQTEAGKDQYGHRNVAGWVTDATTCQWIDNIWLGALNDGWNIAGTADVTGDGADNLILRSADGMIGYWAEFGGLPEDIVELKNAGNRVLLTTGDFDGDGAADFLWQTIGGDEFSVWSDLNGAFTDNSIGKISDLGGSWSFAGVGDYNGDGKDEILWCDTTTYKTAYSEGNKENFTKLTVIA